MKVVAIIPARMASSRFPGKPLVKIHGKPMIEHVYRRVKYASLIDDVYLATCDEEIARAAGKFGAKVIMTASTHTRGTDRVGEAAQSIEADFIINIQGDEPMVDPVFLDKAVATIKKDKNISCLQVVTPIDDWDVFISPNTVKTVTAKDGRALYFSRQPIPTQARKDFSGAIKQIGIYLMRRDLLLQFSRWEETALEKIEKIDMLRFLENGVTMHTFMSNDMLGVDTPEQLSAVETALRDDQVYKKIFAAAKRKKP